MCADKIYRSRGSHEFCKEHGIRLSGPRLGRPHVDPRKKRELERIERNDERMRIPIEGKIGEGKRCYTLDRLCTKLKETSEMAIMMSFIVMNLARFSRDRARSLLFALYDLLHAMLCTAILRWIGDAADMKFTGIDASAPSRGLCFNRAKDKMAVVEQPLVMQARTIDRP